jgi:hypothetical protein
MGGLDVQLGLIGTLADAGQTNTQRGGNKLGRAPTNPAPLLSRRMMQYIE